MKPIDYLIKKLSGPTPYPPIGLSYKTFQRRDEHQKRLYVTMLYSRAIVNKGDDERESIWINHSITTYIPKIDEIKEMMTELVEDHLNVALENGYELDYTKPMLEKYIGLPKPF